MNKTDKIVAIFGVSIIVLLAIVAIILLLRGNSSSPVKVANTEIETVEMDEPELDTVAQEDTEDEMVYNGPVVSKVTDSKSGETKNNSASNKSSEIKNGKYVKKKLLALKNNDAQMGEIYGYWKDSRMEAVYDLINLERVRNLTKDLANTDGFYYYGEINSDNRPEGLGLAIYANDTYYFGQWKAGLREGRGMLLQIFPDKEVTVGKYNAVKEHFYTGEFKKDLPNGKGQENYVYNTENINGEDYLINVIGGFKNGYYDSELIIYTVDKRDRRYEWRAQANEGSFVLCEENLVSSTGKRPVWKKGDDNDHSKDESDNGYFWLKEADNANWGVFGLMK